MGRLLVQWFALSAIRKATPRTPVLSGMHSKYKSRGRGKVTLRRL